MSEMRYETENQIDFCVEMVSFFFTSHQSKFNSRPVMLRPFFVCACFQFLFFRFFSFFLFSVSFSYLIFRLIISIGEIDEEKISKSTNFHLMNFSPHSNNEWFCNFTIHINMYMALALAILDDWHIMVPRNDNSKTTVFVHFVWLPFSENRRNPKTGTAAAK